MAPGVMSTALQNGVERMDRVEIVRSKISFRDFIVYNFSGCFYS